MTSKKSQSPGMPPRKRLLNLIFFIDASKTRTFVMPMDRAAIFAVVVGMTALWALISVVLVAKYKSENTQLRTKLQTALNTVFDYQTRFDDVFERAYPESVGKDYLAAKTPDTPRSQPQQEAPSVAAKNPPAETTKPSEKKAAVESNADAVEKLALVEEISWKLKGSNLDLQFTIKSPEPNTKVEGYVWGIARFESADGQVSYVGVPSEIDVDEQGEASASQRSYLYSIRFLKRRNFSFAAPADVAGVFNEVKIFLTSKKGQKTVYPVDMYAAVQPADSVQATPTDPEAKKESKLDGASIQSRLGKIYAKRRATGARKRH